ncbi:MULTISPECIES: putative quinol monooxygenase [Actinomycetes]|uniref:Quinol monooxygenase n=2 Tax=Actinomycetes TaxID=1760 RepID=A0ABP6LUS8_9MICC
MSTAQPVVVTASFHPAEGRRDEVIAALEKAIPRVHEEPGCNLYCIQDAPDGTLLMIEHWDSAEALDGHGAGEPVAELNRDLEGSLARPVEVTRLTPRPIGQPAKGALLG